MDLRKTKQTPSTTAKQKSPASSSKKYSRCCWEIIRRPSKHSFTPTVSNAPMNILRYSVWRRNPVTEWEAPIFQNRGPLPLTFEGVSCWYNLGLICTTLIFDLNKILKSIVSWNKGKVSLEILSSRMDPGIEVEGGANEKMGVEVLWMFRIYDYHSTCISIRIHFKYDFFLQYCIS